MQVPGILAIAKELPATSRHRASFRNAQAPAPEDQDKGETLSGPERPK